MWSDIGFVLLSTNMNQDHISVAQLDSVSFIIMDTLSLVDGHSVLSYASFLFCCLILVVMIPRLTSLAC
jgi:hypothetical protein